MWLVYVIAAVLGGGFLLVQVLSGHHDVGGHDIDAGDHHAIHGPGILSTRSLMFGLTAFGLVGGPLQILGILTPGTALAVAVASATGASIASGWVFRAVGASSASGAAAFDELRGRPARVLVSLSRTQRGKIRASLKGHLVDLVAVTEGDEIGEGAEVTIVEVRDDVAHVVRA